jgi:hypothetical protein
VWIRDISLAGIEERIFGLSVEEVRLPPDKVVIVIEIPASPRGCHMVTFKGLNQFWKRHGRRKDRMTVDEIRDGFLRVADARERIDRFLRMRRVELLDWAEGECILTLSAIPAYFRDEAIIDVADPELRNIMINPPILPELPCAYNRIDCGMPYPSLEGRRAERRDPKSLLAVHRNGYAEFAATLRPQSGEPPRYATVADTNYVNHFTGFARQFLEQYMPSSPALVGCSILNARGLRLASGGYRDRDLAWAREHLELGEYAVEDPDSEARLLPKRICDRLWNAFGLEKSWLFDERGNWDAGKT